MYKYTFFTIEPLQRLRIKTDEGGGGGGGGGGRGGVNERRIDIMCVIK